MSQNTHTIIFYADTVGKLIAVGSVENVHVQGSIVPMRNIDILNAE